MRCRTTCRLAVTQAVQTNPLATTDDPDIVALCREAGTGRPPRAQTQAHRARRVASLDLILLSGLQGAPPRSGLLHWLRTHGPLLDEDALFPRWHPGTMPRTITIECWPMPKHGTLGPVCVMDGNPYEALSVCRLGPTFQRQITSPSVAHTVLPAWLLLSLVAVQGCLRDRSQLAVAHTLWGLAWDPEWPELATMLYGSTPHAANREHFQNRYGDLARTAIPMARVLTEANVQWAAHWIAEHAWKPAALKPFEMPVRPAYVEPYL